MGYPHIVGKGGLPMGGVPCYELQGIEHLLEVRDLIKLEVCVAFCHKLLGLLGFSREVLWLGNLEPGRGRSLERLWVIDWNKRRLGWL